MIGYIMCRSKNGKCYLYVEQYNWRVHRSLNTLNNKVIFEKVVFEQKKKIRCWISIQLRFCTVKTVKVARTQILTVQRTWISVIPLRNQVFSRSSNCDRILKSSDRTTYDILEFLTKLNKTAHVYAEYRLIFGVKHFFRFPVFFFSFFFLMITSYNSLNCSL